MKIKKTQDVALIKKLMLEALKTDPTAFTSTFEEYNSQSEYWWNNYLFSYEIGRNIMLIAKEGDDVLGMVAVSKNKNERSLHICNIYWFYVLPNARGKGVGKSLMKEVLEVIKTFENIRKINLTVVSEQAAALKIYRDLGFSVCGEQKEELLINNKYYNYIYMEKFCNDSI